MGKVSNAVMNSLIRNYYLAAYPTGIDIYTDHKIPIFLLDSLAVVDKMSQSSIGKVL